MGQEHSAEFNLNPHTSSLDQQNNANMQQYMRNQPKGRQRANDSNMSSNSRGFAQKGQPGAAYVDGSRLQPGKREQAQRVAQALEGSTAAVRGENQMPLNSGGKISGQSEM